MKFLTKRDPRDILNLGYIVGETYDSYGGGYDTIIGYTDEGWVEVRDENGRHRFHCTSSYGRKPIDFSEGVA